ncbi:MAG: hypothetical protein HYV92_00300 [Candidatus Rokubacteria bacterium]|jgi:hypothetical protein|nr:hypothetical protein [Candidatus Rokubacteria bacterium]MBI2544467.1 hypothetical protein [Candidatus Rokubacteria bacterium]MBI2552890.1 hypothetical protein [Candidatus Rokubacteria bacterium]
MQRGKTTLWLLAALFTAGCIVPPPAGTPLPPRVEILGDHTRASLYGKSAADMLDHPAIREKVRSLFGSDWGGGAVGGPGVAAAAPEFFSRSFPPRLIQVRGWEYVAASGCMANACRTHRGLLLVRSDGGELLARLDEGGYTHYYVFGVGMLATPENRAAIDAVRRALE